MEGGKIMQHLKTENCVMWKKSGWMAWICNRKRKNGAWKLY